MSEMCCPRCGCPEFSIRTYDYGVDPETGYMDSGVIAKCAGCDAEADVEDFQCGEPPCSAN